VDRHHGTADFALVIGEPDAWGRGYGTEATRLTLAYAFDVLGLYNVYLVVYANNARGIRAYERAGFKRIGVRRGAHKLGRRRYDEIHMDAVADDFPPSHLHALLHPDEG
jgi:RimJ/RimL family protein N-acetyltransferase